jgi:hypothetical protein
MEERKYPTENNEQMVWVGCCLSRIALNVQGLITQLKDIDLWWKNSTAQHAAYEYPPVEHTHTLILKIYSQMKSKCEQEYLYCFTV